MQSVGSCFGKFCGPTIRLNWVISPGTMDTCQNTIWQRNATSCTFIWEGSLYDQYYQIVNDGNHHIYGTEFANRTTLVTPKLSCDHGSSVHWLENSVEGTKALFCRSVFRGFVRVLSQPNPIHQETWHGCFVGRERTGKTQKKTPGKHVGSKGIDTRLGLVFYPSLARVVESQGLGIHPNPLGIILCNPL
jgi:hypothetical protein